MNNSSNHIIYLLYVLVNFLAQHAIFDWLKRPYYYPIVSSVPPHDEVSKILLLHRALSQLTV